MNALWLKYFPSFIRNRLLGRHDLQTILGNTSWLFADKILRMGVGLFVGVWIARYLGPEQFGLWSYAVAFTSLFSVFATLGLDGILVRELVKTPERQNELLGSAFVLKLIGGIFTLLSAIFVISVLRTSETLTTWLVGISAAGFIFQSINVVEFYFQAKVKSKYTVIAANAAFVLTTLVKIFLVMTLAPLTFFAWAGLGEIILTSVFLLLAYRIDRSEIRSWRYSRQTAGDLIKDSWPLIFSSFAIMIQARVDQVMLGDMISNAEVGQYSAAMRLIEVFAFVPMIIVSTISPYITKAKMVSEALYYKKLLEVYRLMIITFLLVAVPIFFFGEQMVILIFGNDYKRAGALLSLLSIRLFFANFGIAKSLFITNENIFKYSLLTSISGAMTNIIGNYLLIPYYNAEGAIIATIISFFVTIFLIDIFFSRTRSNLKLMIKAILIPYSFTER